MFRVSRQLVLAALFSLGDLSQIALSQTSPEAQLMREFKQGVNQTDPQLDKWLQEIYEGKSPIALSDAEFQAAVQKLSPGSRTLLQLKRAQSGQNERDIAREALQKIKAKDQTWANDVLLPYLLQAIVDGAQVDTKDRELAKELLLENTGASCPRKRALLADLRTQDRQSIKADEAKRYINLFRGFNSLGFREEALRALLTGMSAETLKDLRKELAAAIQPFPRLVNDNPGLLDDPGEGANIKSALGSIYLAEKMGGKEQCQEATKSLLKGMREDSNKQQLPFVEAVATKLESCWRSRGDKARLAFWQELEGPLRETYGFKGESLAQRRLGLIYWGRNEFKEARKIFSVLLLASEKDFPEVHADTLFTYARVSENEGEFVEAIEKYRLYIELYPETEQSNQAAASLIVLSTLLKRNDDALAYALQMIEREAPKTSDNRDGTNLPMALYWAGKTYFEKNDRPRAEFYWSRLAQEFYSTFYGALGQYALEKMNKKRYFLPPIETPLFNRDDLFREFATQDRSVLERAEKLLLLGMREDAACEIKEIPIQDSDTNRQLAKAIFQYAAGDWLGAVRIYQNLPKSFRITLPRGMERVLFPRTYTPLVHQYAEKLDIDPSYVNAIIRQESVFNPKAQSPVGARGLMQLMPETARLEAKALRSDYVHGDIKQSISSVHKNESVLNDPETNIALGVQHVHRLFQKYKNPVFVLTSYNANPRATERWIQNIESSDMVLFIERIPYRETRSYVKLVMRNYFYYKRWYEGANVSIPLFEGLLPRMLADHKANLYQATSVP